MRQQFIPFEAPEGQDKAATIDEARDVAPWAAEIIEADGGWQAFESAADAETWREQV